MLCLTCGSLKGVPTPQGGERWLESLDPFYAAPFCSHPCIDRFRANDEDRQIAMILGRASKKVKDLKRRGADEPTGTRWAYHWKKMWFFRRPIPSHARHILVLEQVE